MKLSIVNYMSVKFTVMNNIKMMQEKINGGYPFDTLLLESKSLDELHNIQDSLISEYNKAVKENR